jgi:putative intracellular protease/amidase
MGLLVLALAGLVGCASSGDVTSTQNGALSQTSGQARVLVIVSAADHIDVEGGGTTAAGVYLAEVAVPVRTLVGQQVAVTFVSPGGKPPTLDAVSDKPSEFDDEADFESAKKTLDDTGFHHPAPLESVTDDDVRSYDAVFIPGGHAPMTDLRVDANVARILRVQHQAGKLTGSLCHGPAALLADVAADPTTKHPWIYAGYHLTALSAGEEILATVTGLVGGQPAVHLESALIDAGASFRQNLLPFKSNVVQDRELVTGQNPQSAKEFAQAFAQALQQQRASGPTSQ